MKNFIKNGKNHFLVVYEHGVMVLKVITDVYIADLKKFGNWDGLVLILDADWRILDGVLYVEGYQYVTTRIPLKSYYFDGPFVGSFEEVNALRGQYFISDIMVSEKVRKRFGRVKGVDHIINNKGYLPKKGVFVSYKTSIFRLVFP